MLFLSLSFRPSFRFSLRPSFRSSLRFLFWFSFVLLFWFSFNIFGLPRIIFFSFSLWPPFLDVLSFRFITWLISRPSLSFFVLRSFAIFSSFWPHFPLFELRLSILCPLLVFFLSLFIKFFPLFFVGLPLFLSLFILSLLLFIHFTQSLGFPLLSFLLHRSFIFFRKLIVRLSDCFSFSFSSFKLSLFLRSHFAGNLSLPFLSSLFELSLFLFSHLAERLSLFPFRTIFGARIAAFTFMGLLFSLRLRFRVLFKIVA